MDRRYETRFPSDLPVRVTNLEDDTQSFTGTLLDISVSGICVLLPAFMPAGAVVKLELADTVLNGQIAYANEGNGTFRTGITVEQVLVQESDLSNILQALLEKTEDPCHQTRLSC